MRLSQLFFTSLRDDPADAIAHEPQVAVRPHQAPHLGALGRVGRGARDVGERERALGPVDDAPGHQGVLGFERARAAIAGEVVFGHRGQA